MNREKRLHIIVDEGMFDASWLYQELAPNAEDLIDGIDNLPTEAFKNALQNRLELCQKDVDNWFKELIQKVGDYAE